MRRLFPYHEERLAREPPETSPDVDHEREARIEAEARAVTRPTPGGLEESDRE